MEQTSHRPTGMTAFIIIWAGQILSLLGTAVSQFGLGLWTWDAGGQRATPMTLIGVLWTVPMVIFTPLVGVLVDRTNRKVMMMLSDLAAAFNTVVVLILFTTGHLQIWHLYVTAFIGGTFQGFQWPAYSAAISTMLDKKHYARANAMLDLAGNSSAVFAPLLAGALIGPLGVWFASSFPSLAARVAGEPGLTPLLVLDLISAAFAIGSLLFVHIPQPTQSASGQSAQGSFWHQSIYGLRYILARPSLLGLQLVFMFGNLFHALGASVRSPMVLARTGGDKLVFGSVQTAAAVGAIAGGLVLGAWGGFRRRVHGVLLGWVLHGIALVVAGMARSPAALLITGFSAFFFGPIINSSNQAIWQAKVAPDVQGRVFATRRLIAWLVSPLSQAIAGPLADNVFEPALNGGAMGIGIWARLFGVESGAGMGLQIALAGVLAALVGLSAYLFPAVRQVEDRLPDHDQPVPAVEPGAETETETAPA